MTTTNSQQIIEGFLADLAERNPHASDGKWLEELTIAAAPHIRDWDIADAYSWAGWPEREGLLGLGPQDIGIDVVARRRADGGYVAVQCKARQLDEAGRGAAIARNEIAKFAAASGTHKSFWAERWLVTNGANDTAQNAKSLINDSELPIKVINIHADLRAQASALAQDEPATDADADGAPRQSRSDMQDEAVAQSVSLLRRHAASGTGGLPIGQARGKIILPCGTGKTRISLRIVEALAGAGELAIVLCPSIALVAQIRREYLQHAQTPIRALAVCSDQTAGYNPAKEGSRNTAEDPTLDNSNVSAIEVKGKVTTNADEIADWIRQGAREPAVNVIFGTYQSGRRVADALQATGVTAQVLIADEAHRTAGLKLKKRRDPAKLREDAARVRDFTLCHDNREIPAKYRVYQTATPRVYDTSAIDNSPNWAVHNMDDEATFGIDLYRKSYAEAVRNGWLADYRIIAVGITGPDASEIANRLVRDSADKGRNKPTMPDYLRGLAFTLAMGGATQHAGEDEVRVQSCIAFMNTVNKSKNMARDLASDAAREWLANRLRENADESADESAAASQAEPARYSLEHLDATSNVAARENAKRRLAAATPQNPHGVINVGIFGEGTDSPSLSAVAFLEARKSPIDVIQAVGRAMRTAPGKKFGYIICPIVIPTNTDPEEWLSSAQSNEGWSELGQILLALRAHDSRIEDELHNLLKLYLPKGPEIVTTMVAIGQEDKRVHSRLHIGPPGSAAHDAKLVAQGESTMLEKFQPIDPARWQRQPAADTYAAPQAQSLIPDEQAAQDDQAAQAAQYAQSDSPPNVPPSEFQDVPAAYDENSSEATPQPSDAPSLDEQPSDAPDAPAVPPAYIPEPTQIIAAKKNADGSVELRADSIRRDAPKPDQSAGAVNIAKSKRHARDMINNGKGARLPDELPPPKTNPPAANKLAGIQKAMSLMDLSDGGNPITMNLLAKSGLTKDRVLRDLNLLRESVYEAARLLDKDELQPELNKHFGIDHLNPSNARASSTVTAALLIMNAAMLHQRIANGAWLPAITSLDAVKTSEYPIRDILRQWNAIISHDFKPVMDPAVRAINAIEDTGRTTGLELALRYLAGEAARIAETYADMGSDHAGPLFNRVMGDQKSDGAFFTRPPAASIAAKLTLDAAGSADWTSPDTWRANKTLDLACGSGTLLAAMLAEMKRRARQQGATERQITDLHRLAVEETIKGLDINPVSLQLAASQLTAGNHYIRYRKMGLHQMPYGPQAHNPAHIAAGAIELLGQSAIVPIDGTLNLGDDAIASQSVWNEQDSAELEDAVDAAQNARVVIMNPPFTSRGKMGEKFTKETQRALRNRADSLEQTLIRSDAEMQDFVDKNSIAPLFVALADKCVRQTDGVLTLIHPTIALSNPSGLEERRILAQRYHIHTILTSHQSGNINLSQNTAINESVIVAARHEGAKPPTRIINLDRFPVDDVEAADLHTYIAQCETGAIPNGWGEVSYWPAERIAAGDWTAAIWRSPELAQAAARFANDVSLKTSEDSGLLPQATGRSLRGSFEPADYGHPGAFPILKSKGTDAQIRIQSQPDEHWIPKKRDERIREANGGTYPESDKILSKAGYLLITAGQDNSTGRLTAVAGDEKYVGNGWMPITGLSPEQAKALAVFLNSTPGRLQLMRNAGRKLEFPTYSVKEAANIRIPDLSDARVLERLAGCYERTRLLPVPQYRAGESAVRRIWDESVAAALGWDALELERIRLLLHAEPHVRGLGYGQYGEAWEVGPAGEVGGIPHLPPEGRAAAAEIAAQFHDLWASLPAGVPLTDAAEDAFYDAFYALDDRMEVLLSETYGLSDDQITDVERALRLIHATDEEEDAALIRSIEEAPPEDRERLGAEALYEILREWRAEAEADADADRD